MRNQNKLTFSIITIFYDLVEAKSTVRYADSKTAIGSFLLAFEDTLGRYVECHVGLVQTRLQASG